jgi:glucose-6-phosphate 1-dehydrogenase
MTLERPAHQDFVIIGATGDLSRRKLLPALFSLYRNGLLPEQCEIIGSTRTSLDNDAFRKLAHDAVIEFAPEGFDEAAWGQFARCLSFVQLRTEGYEEISNHCRAAERVFYLATPPAIVPDIVRNLATRGLNENARIVVEKPFGTDLASARELNRALHEVFDESHIYRIDHYLGKETVQNILICRFANAVFERVWNRDAIQHIQITVAESIGIEGRASFYEGIGALRDIVQNHGLQMLALLTMEPPTSFTAESIRDEKAKLLDAVRPVDPRRVVRGQYNAGVVLGKPVPGYRNEPGVAPDSMTETYVALELFIDNWRWSGVPIYLRTGKRLPHRSTEVEIAFRDVPMEYLGEAAHLLHPNHFIYRIQPDEGIVFRLLTKVPGPALDVRQTDMEFSYEDGFMVKPAEAYERLIHDVMHGDQTLFVREDAIERAWEIIQPVLDAPPPLFTYEAGSWGPAEADNLVAPSVWHLR